jgi:hypothetical protein
MLSDIDGFISACLDHELKTMALVAFRAREIDGLARCISVYLKNGLFMKHDEQFDVIFNEDGTFEITPFEFEIDEWPYKTRTVPRAALVDISEMDENVLKEFEEFERTIQRN